MNNRKTIEIPCLAMYDLVVSTTRKATDYEYRMASWGPIPEALIEASEAATVEIDTTDYVEITEES